MSRAEIVEAAQRSRLAMLVLTRTLAGNNTVTFSGVNTTLAVDSDINDLTSAISASEK